MDCEIVNKIDLIDDTIKQLTQEYINDLMNPELIYKNNVFTGLIKRINKHLFTLNHKQKEELLSDIVLLNNIWYKYTELCYLYNQKPTIEEFSLLSSISHETLSDWYTEKTRAEYSEELSCTRSAIVKSWRNESRLGRYKGAEAGNVGCIFLSKAVDGLIETAPQQVIQHVHTRGIDQIAAEHQTQIVDIGTEKAEF